MVHDLFNLLTVLVLLPLEVISGYLEEFSKLIVNGLLTSQGKTTNPEFLNALTKEFTNLIIQIDMDSLTAEFDSNSTLNLIKHNCTNNSGNITKCNIISTLSLKF